MVAEQFVQPSLSLVILSTLIPHSRLLQHSLRLSPSGAVLSQKSVKRRIQASLYLSFPVRQKAFARFNRKVCLLKAKHHSSSSKGMWFQSIFPSKRTGVVHLSISYLSVKMKVLSQALSARSRR